MNQSAYFNTLTSYQAVNMTLCVIRDAGNALSTQRAYEKIGSHFLVRINKNARDRIRHSAGVLRRAGYVKYGSRGRWVLTDLGKYGPLLTAEQITASEREAKNACNARRHRAYRGTTNRAESVVLGSR